MTKTSLIDELQIVEGTIKDYLPLDDFHYLNTPLPPVKKVYIVRPKFYVSGEYKNYNTFAASKHAYTLAVIVYCCPLRDLKARTEATSGYFKQPKTMRDRLRLINKNILYVARLVVDPRYRKIGIADWLWRETLKMQTIPIVESLSTLPIREKWLNSLGFELFYSPTPQSIRLVHKAFRKARISEKCLTVPEMAQLRIAHLTKDAKIKLNRSLHYFLSNFRHHEHMPDNVERMRYILSKIPYPNGYLIWFNPRIKPHPVLSWINAQITGGSRQKTRPVF